MNSEQIPHLGIDIGRVIIDGSSHPQGGDTAFFNGDEQTMLATPEMNGAIDSISRLVDTFGGRVWLVSKCGPRVRARSERWLRAHRFFERTGLDQADLRFCRRRPEKRQICLDLGLTHFVDDHPEVHRAIRDVVPNQYLFGPQRKPAPAYTTPVRDWTETEAALVASFQ